MSEKTSAAKVAASSARAPGPCHWICTVAALTGSSTITATFRDRGFTAGTGARVKGSGPRDQSPKT